MQWLTAKEALARLGTKPQTLYANVSRGRITARPDPADTRRSLYSGEDVERLAGRQSGRRKAEVVASEAMHWGEPVLPTAISAIERGRLFYRGRDACELAETASLEDIAALLWQSPVHLAVDGVATGQGLVAAFSAIAMRAAQPMMPGRPPDAGLVLGTLAQVLAGDADAGHPVHMRLARKWHRPEASDAIRRALVLLADHELNASTFAARVTVSTGASFWAGTLTGLATLSGPRHGLAFHEITALAEDLAVVPEAAETALRNWLDEGRYVPGMGHQLYPRGDPRCVALLAGFDLPRHFAAYRAAAEAITGDLPNVDFAIAALVSRFALPADAGFTLFALGRAVGWLAHMMEQVAAGTLIRPRAHYVGDRGNAG
jgi:citrate synthase